MLVVTGGSGFIGSNLVATLESRYSLPICVCDMFGVDDKWRNLEKHHPYEIITPEECFHFLDENKNLVTTVFHLGANSTTTEKNVDLMLKQNFLFSKKLLNWCSINRVRLIYASSAATYGDGRQGFEDASALSYLRNLCPLNPYAWSKHLFDLAIAQVREEYIEAMLPPQLVGLKFFNVYGPNEYHKGKMMSLVPQFYKQIQENGTVRLFKSTTPQFPDGGQMRDFIYVDDCVEMMLWFYEHPELSGLFNAGTGKARSFNDLAAALFKTLELPQQLMYEAMPHSLRAQYQSFTQADMNKLTSIGYTRPFISLEEGVERYLKDYLTQADPFR